MNFTKTASNHRNFDRGEKKVIFIVKKHFLVNQKTGHEARKCNIMISKCIRTKTMFTLLILLLCRNQKIFLCETMNSAWNITLKTY